MFKIGTREIRVQLREDRAVLMVCIGVAFIFWLLVKLSQTYTAEKEVVFGFSIPEEKALTVLPPDDVEIELEGRGWDLMFDYFARGKVELFFDMNEQSRVRLNWLQLKSLIQKNLSSSEIKITEINYDDLSLSLENRMKKTIPIQLAADLSFSPGYHLKSPIQLSPDSISISGPESLVSNIMDWRTDSLILKDIQNSAEKKISLRESAREIKLNQQTITAKLEVEQFTEKSFFVKILQRNAPDSIRIFPDRIKIYCLVGLSKYEEVEESGFTVEVDLKDAKPGVENNAVPILLTKSPDFVDNVRFSPKSAEYIFIKKVEEEKSPSPTE
jgi:hypothetical protein